MGILESSLGKVEEEDEGEDAVVLTNGKWDGSIFSRNGQITLAKRLTSKYYRTSSDSLANKSVKGDPAKDCCAL